jgi:hypothetical protein
LSRFQALKIVCALIVQEPQSIVSSNAQSPPMGAIVNENPVLGGGGAIGIRVFGCIHVSMVWAIGVGI